MTNLTIRLLVKFEFLAKSDPPSSFFTNRTLVIRPDCEYKTAKMIYQKYSHQAGVGSCNVKGKGNSMVYITAFDRSMLWSNEWISQKQLAATAR